MLRFRFLPVEFALVAKRFLQSLVRSELDAAVGGKHHGRQKSAVQRGESLRRNNSLVVDWTSVADSRLSSLAHLLLDDGLERVDNARVIPKLGLAVDLLLHLDLHLHSSLYKPEQKRCGLV